MNKHPHIIARQIFDIDYSSKEKSHALQDKISKIFNTRLMEEIGELFDRIIPSNRSIRLDSLVLDIGDIASNSLEDELPKRVVEKLEQELRLLLLHDNSSQREVEFDGNYSDDPKGNYLQLLEYFLLKGSLPWWAATEGSFSMSMVLEFLFNNSSLKLRDLILRLGQKSFVRKRLVYQFPEQLIKYIIVLLEPEEAEFIFEYHQAVIGVQRDEQLIKDEESEFKKSVWLFILSYLIVDKSSHFSRKEFVKSTLASMAANFNINLTQLLSLFAAGLKSEGSEIPKTDSLYTIILELFEEVQQSVEPPYFKTSNSDKMGLEKISQDVELIRYFLTFGSFPWWSVYPDQQVLFHLIANMIQNHPKTFSRVIRSVGQSQFSRQVMVRSFNEELLESIVNLIEPEEGEFILQYVSEAKGINNKEKLLKVQSQNLAARIWEFILEYLLIDRGSDFNRKIFLESNIKRLASHFNLKYHELLVFLIQNMGTSHSASIRHVSLFQTLHSLYEQTKDNIESEMIVFNDPDEASIPSGQMFQKIQQTGLRNVLYFWLKFGYFPWWSEKFADHSASELIERLIYESPEDAIILLKFSGQKYFSRRRILNQISPKILFKLLLLLPDGTKAIRYLEQVVMEVSNNALFRTQEFAILERVIISALWDSYFKDSYKEFKSRQYLQLVLINLSLWSKLSVKDIVAALNTDLLEKQAKTQLNQIFNNSDKYDEQIKFLEKQQFLPIWVDHPNIEEIIFNQFKAEFPENDSISETDLLKEAIFILSYFLQYNKLPEKYKVSSEATVNALLRQLLLLLNQLKPAELELILESKKYPAQHFFRLHDISRQADSVSENSLKTLLNSKLEKNILLFIKQSGAVNLNARTLFQFIEKYISNPILKSNQDLLKLLLQYPSVSIQFAHYFENKLIYELLQTGGSNGLQITPAIQTLNNWLLGLFSDTLERDKLDLLLKTYNFMIIGGWVEITNIQVYFRLFLVFLSENNKQILKRITSVITAFFNNQEYKNSIILNHLPDIKETVDEFTAYADPNNDLFKIQKNSDSQLLEDLLKLSSGELRDIDIKHLKQEIREQEQIDKKNLSEQLSSDKETVYIHNAGLVLLHPFLSTYFNRLQMLKDGDFVSEEHRHRAVHLLQYLVFGTETNEEHELVLNKILCNIPLEEPLNSGIILTEQEKTISAELLNAVPAQWDKLRNTTVESLQASFLQRDGALTHLEESWNLKVEQRGYDVLLQTLPWGLGMIKTSWMKEFIYVEWM